MGPDPAMYRMMFDHLPAGCIVVSDLALIQEVNSYAVKVLGKGRDDLVQTPIEHYIQESSRSSLRSMLHESFLKTEVVSGELVVVRSDASTVFVKAEFTRFPGLPFCLLTLSDITPLKQAEERFHEFTAKLRDLSAHIETGMEAERKRLAREIHDGLGSSLSALKMEISLLRKQLAGTTCGQLNPGAGTGLKAMSDLIDSMVDLVRKLVTELRPGVLDELGLVATIRWFAGDYRNRTGIETVVNVYPEDFDLDPVLSTTLFRIFQEIMTNISRHAHASRVTVFLRKQDHLFQMRIQDNGIGISHKDMNSKRSFGIIGMQERVRLQHGRIEITGSPGKGTGILVEIPLTNI